MALMKTASEIPKDAVVMDEVAATTYAWDIVTNWDKKSETWALMYSPAVLGGINAVTGIVINRFYRHKLKLGSYGYMSSVIPISLMPGMMTALFHRHLVSTEMLLMKKESCPLCYELRANAIQLGFGILYPMVLGPTSALMFANRYNTYRIPSLVDGPKVMFAFMKKLSKSLSSTLVFASVIQFVASSALTYYEMSNNLAIRKKVLEIEKIVAQEHGLE